MLRMLWFTRLLYTFLHEYRYTSSVFITLKEEKVKNKFLAKCRSQTARVRTCSQVFGLSNSLLPLRCLSRVKLFVLKNDNCVYSCLNFQIYALNKDPEFHCRALSVPQMKWSGGNENSVFMLLSRDSRKHSYPWPGNALKYWSFERYYCKISLAVLLSFFIKIFRVPNPWSWSYKHLSCA